MSLFKGKRCCLAIFPLVSLAIAMYSLKLEYRLPEQSTQVHRLSNQSSQLGHVPDQSIQMHNLSKQENETHRLSAQESQNHTSLDLDLPINITSNCSNVSVPIVAPNQDMWQPVSGIADVVLYSAFLDNGSVTLVGVTHARNVEHAQLTCQLWYRHVTSGEVVVVTSPVRISRIPQGEEYSYITALFLCDVHTSRVPFATAVVHGNDVCQSPSNRFYVYQSRRSQPAKDRKFNFTICVPPLRSADKKRYPSPQQLIEWIEMNRLFGVQFFTFYNDSIHSGVADIFRHYEKQGIVEILRWNRLELLKRVFYGGQVASMHDCLYRQKQRSAYTGFIDVDEFIVPHKHEDFTWHDMFRRLHSACSYSFKSTFFTGEYSLEEHTHGFMCSPNKSYILNNMKRQERLSSHESRSKLIVKPEEVTLIDVHKTISCNRGKQHYFVSSDIAMVQHYRDAHPKLAEVFDNTSLKYQANLTERLKTTCNRLQNDTRT